MRYTFNPCRSSLQFAQTMGWERIVSILNMPIPTGLQIDVAQHGILMVATIINIEKTNISKVVKQTAKMESTFRPIPKHGNVEKTLNIFELECLRSSDVLEKFIGFKQERFFDKGNDYHIFILDINAVTGNLHQNFYLNQLRNAAILSFPKNNNFSTPAMFQLVKLCYFCHEDYTPSPEFRKINKSSSILTMENLPPLFRNPNETPNFHHKMVKISCNNNTKVRLNLIQRKDGTWIPEVPSVFGSYLFHISHKFNYSGVYMTSSGGGGTGVIINGTWNGVTGDIYEERSQIGVIVGINLNRFKSVAFTTAGEYQSLVMVTGKHYQIFTWELLSTPLQSSVWLAMGCALGVSVVAIYGIQEFYRTYVIDLLPRRERSKIKLWENERILEYLFAAFFEEQAPNPSIRSLRLFLGLWLFCTITMSTAYNSKLYSVLAFPPLDFQPKNFDELVTSEYKWGLDFLGEVTVQYLKSSTDPVGKKLYKGMDIHTDTAKCMIPIMSRRYACITYTTLLDFVIARNFSRAVNQFLTESKSSSVFTVAICLTTQKDSPLELEMNKVIGQAVSQDLQQKWLRMYHAMIKKRRDTWVERLKSEGKEPPPMTDLEDAGGPGSAAGGEKKFVKFSIKKLQGAFFALFIGLVVGFGVMLWEIRRTIS
ncbi:Glutamate receptor ionotropic, NMDA 3B [Folsomia candida]|uniref:Glutamate receptor ionotropic, NMDA 3B n=1 Tax=Folsomia candida TaxID=158441 RepID=A0A226F094_FOLCA|nr:Glutamate receptor ionotropic, NMDA 3B [Folsomia candida]